MDALSSVSFCIIDRVTNWGIMTVTFGSFAWRDFCKYNYGHIINLSKNLQFLSPVERL